MKIKKCNSTVCNMYDKKEYVVDIRALKQAQSWDYIKSST